MFGDNRQYATRLVLNVAHRKSYQRFLSHSHPSKAGWNRTVLFMTENVLHKAMDPFENPECLPLEELKLKVKTDGIVEIVSALNKRWADNRYFLYYESPKIHNEDGSEIIGAKERWLEIVSYIIEDLKWLLSLPFYRFWSNVVFNTSILDTLVSFLQEAPPFYALENFPNSPEMLEHLEMLSRNVLVVFARLVTNKDSPAQYMSHPFHGNLLYENYLFTIPIIFDLCQLYGRENARTMERILKSLFTLEPLYNDDLRKAVPCLIKALDNVEIKFQTSPVDDNAEIPVSLSKKHDNSTKITLYQLEDMMLYVLDISSTINVLLKNYPAAVVTFQNEDFMNKLVSIYAITIPEMYKRLSKLGYNDENMPKYIELKHRLDVTRIEILNLYRIILYEPILSIQEQFTTISEAKIKESVDNYIHLLTNAISEKEFIMDYNQFYPVDKDFEILADICSEIDIVKCDFVLQSIYATIGESKVPAIASASSRIEAVAGPSGIQSQSGSSSNNIGNSVGGGKRENPAKLAALVAEIKDIFNDQDEAFIEICLRHYNYDAAAVINAVLENNLPPHLLELKGCSMSAGTQPNPTQSEIDAELASGVGKLNLSEDYDEARVTTRPVVDVPKDYITRNYSLVVDEYDDEYDDTYDNRDVRDMQNQAVEADSRPFTTPRVLLAKQKNESASEDESEAEENTKTEQNGRDQFIENPAVLRARAEQRRQDSRGGRTFNVLGKPKGKGQDKDVLHNRHEKNTHKATQANHNRRTGAQHKRRQGMIPS